MTREKADMDAQKRRVALKAARFVVKLTPHYVEGGTGGRRCIT